MPFIRQAYGDCRMPGPARQWAFSLSGNAFMSQRIFFAHANGFPSATYRKLFDALAPEYEVTHMDRHGHDPRFPVDDNWNNLLDELFEQLERLHEPVWGIGHSFGGMLHYRAEIGRAHV